MRVKEKCFRHCPVYTYTDTHTRVIFILNITTHVPFGGTLFTYQIDH